MVTREIYNGYLEIFDKDSTIKANLDEHEYVLLEPMIFNAGVGWNYTFFNDYCELDDKGIEYEDGTTAIVTSDEIKEDLQCLQSLGEE